MSNYPPQPPQNPPPPPPPGQYPQGYPPQQYPPPGQYPQQQPVPYYNPMGQGAPGLLCTRCGQYAGKRVTFTWWGGLLGPKMLNHHKCQACGFGFNGTTGQSNSTAILIYSLVAGVIALVVGIFIAVAFFSGRF